MYSHRHQLLHEESKVLSSLEHASTTTTGSEVPGRITIYICTHNTLFRRFQYIHIYDLGDQWQWAASGIQRVQYKELSNHVEPPKQ